MKKHIMTGSLILILLIGLVIVIVRITQNKCVLCSVKNTHCPVLVNVATGETGNLMVYNLHNASPSKLAPVEEQQTGTFSFLSCAGLIGCRDTANELVSINIPIGTSSANRWRFCNACWSLIKQYPDESYLLADLYDPDTPVLMPITADAEYQMRCYKLLIELNEERLEHIITVYGELNIAHP